MNNYREMYEALLRGDTLYCGNNEIVMRHDGVIINQHGAISWIEDVTPINCSIKPKTININGFEVPEPVREPLKEDENFWLTNVDGHPGFLLMKWDNTKSQNFWLSKGMIHRSEAAAVLHAKSLWSFTEKEGV